MNEVVGVGPMWQTYTAWFVMAMMYWGFAEVFWRVEHGGEPRATRVERPLRRFLRLRWAALQDDLRDAWGRD